MYIVFLDINAIAHLTDYGIVQTTFICVGKPKKFMWLYLLQSSGAKPSISEMCLLWNKLNVFHTSDNEEI